MSSPSPPRRSPGRGYAPGLEARQRIIDVAIKIFGSLGFENASTRTIATRAKVNLGSLRYYFGSKKKLYLACVEHIAVYGEAQLEAFADKVGASAGAPDSSREQSLEVLRFSVEMLLEHLVKPRSPSAWIVFLVREQINPGPGSDIVYRRLTRRFIELWSGLIGRIVGRSATDELSLLKTFCILGQLFTFERNLHTVKRTLDWDEIDGQRLATMKRVLWQQIENGLIVRRHKTDR
jgi:AcrR family transcriptional regulator